MQVVSSHVFSLNAAYFQFVNLMCNKWWALLMWQSVFHSESIHFAQTTPDLAYQTYQGHELNQKGAELQPFKQMQNLKKKI